MNVSQETGQDYKLSDKAEQRELISKAGHFGSAPCGVTELLKSVLHINDAVCVLGAGQKHLFESQESLLAFTNQRLSLNMIDCDRAAVAEITLEGWPGYLLFSSPWFCRLIQYQHACVLVFLPSTLYKGFASGITMIMLTGAPGAPGGPSIAPPL